VVGLLGSYVPDLNFSLSAFRCVTPADLPGALHGLAKNAGTSDSGAQAVERDGLSGLLSEVGDDGMILLGQSALNHPEAGTIRTLAARLAQQTGMKLGSLAPANSAGAWWAGAVPHRTAQGMPAKTAGANASQIADLNLNTVLLYGVESSIDHSDPIRLQGMLDRAQTVISFSTFRSAVPDQADIVLPLAPYTECSGSYLNCNGTVQVSSPALTPRGNSRPGWKVLRVLGNFLSLPDFDYDDVAQVATELGHPPGVLMRAANAEIPIPGHGETMSTRPDGLFSLVAERSIYQADPIVRRSRALARTRDGSSEAFCRLHPEDLEAAGLAGASRVLLVGEHHQATLRFTEDSGVARGSVFVFSGSVATAGFGGDSAVRIRPVT